MLTILEPERRLPSATPNTKGINTVLGIGGSFVAAGFIAWGLPQIRELAMSIADWINDRRARDRAKLIAQGYKQGYADARSGRPRRIAATSSDQPGPAAPPPIRPRRHRSRARP